MTNIESSEKQQLTESTLEECGEAAMPAPENPGNPVTMSVTLNASGKDHVSDLIDMMKNAGLEKAGPVTPNMMPMRKDMERLRDIVDGPMDDPDIPGRDDVEGDADLQQGALGAIAGGVAGAAMGGPMGALTGASAGDQLTDDEEIDEAMDPKSLMGQIRKLAKGVETSPDEREHRIFAQQVESDLIDLFQYFDQQNDMEKKKIVQQLIRQNKQAQRETDRRNANNMVTVLWDLMNANEAYVNEPDEEYRDHEFMTKDLSGGINRQKKAYAAAQSGDNAMAVESDDDYVGAVEYHDGTIVYPKIGDTVELFYSDYTDSDDEADHKPNAIGKIVGKGKRDDETFIIKWKDHTSGNVEQDEFSAVDEFRILNKDAEDPNRIKGRKQGQLGLQGGSTKSRRVGSQPKGKNSYTNALHYGEDEMRESIKSRLLQSLEEKKAKPDFLDMDKDGDKKEPMKKAIKDKKKKAPVKESDKEKDDDLSNKLFKRKPGELEKLSKEKNRKMNQKRFMKPGKPSRSGEWATYESENEAEVQAPSHEMSDVARKAASMAQVIKRKINSGDEMDDRDYNQMAELGAVLSRVGTDFGPKSMKDVLAHMVDYTDERNREGHKYPEMNVDRFKELLAMAKS